MTEKFAHLVYRVDEVRSLPYDDTILDMQRGQWTLRDDEPLKKLKTFEEVKTHVAKVVPPKTTILSIADFDTDEYYGAFEVWYGIAFKYCYEEAKTGLDLRSMLVDFELDEFTKLTEDFDDLDAIYNWRDSVGFGLQTIVYNYDTTPHPIFRSQWGNRPSSGRL